MRVFRLSPTVTTLTAVLIISVFSSTHAAQNDKPSSKVRIKNFGCLNEKYYRGAQPGEEDYSDLAAMGVKDRKSVV